MHMWYTAFYVYNIYLERTVLSEDVVDVNYIAL